jgi:hypothetical protein
MGAWGTAISSNDTYADIYDEFFELYNNGLEVDEISKWLIENNQGTINDTDDGNNFWFALAKAQWECQKLDTELYRRVKKIIDTGADIEVWKQLGAHEKDVKKRKSILDKFLTDISIERPKAKVRTKKKQPKIIQPVFEKGDCITYKLENGHFGGAVVLEAVFNNTNAFVNLIAATRINKEEMPTTKDFERSTVLIQNFAMFKDSPNIHWYSPIRHDKVLSLIEVIGKIKVDKTYYVNNSNFYGFCADFDIWIIEETNRQFAFEQKNKKPDKVITIKELTKNSKWKFWQT